MKYEIGPPGRPRLLLETNDPQSAEDQCGPGEVARYVEAFPVHVPKVDLRLKRNAMIAETDWTQLPDTALSDAQRAAWAAYRQALRDVFQNQPDVTPETVVWPEAPGANS